MSSNGPIFKFAPTSNATSQFALKRISFFYLVGEDGQIANEAHDRRRHGLVRGHSATRKRRRRAAAQRAQIDRRLDPRLSDGSMARWLDGSMAQCLDDDDDDDDARRAASGQQLVADAAPSAGNLLLRVVKRSPGTRTRNGRARRSLKRDSCS